MQKKARNEMVKAFEAELKELVRGLLEALMREERAMYLETHPTSASGYYTRDLLTLDRWKTSRCPTYGKAISIPGSSPTESGPP